MFKRVISEKGQEMWYKDGKLTAKKYVPEEDIKKYEETKEELPDVKEEPALPPRKICIICGEPEENQRTVRIDEESISVKLCGDCYYSITLGEIVQKVKKEKENGRI
jgi:hypothetical protein